MQIITGPRQVGKTTAIRQILESLEKESFSTVSASADALASPPSVWISEYWDKADAIAGTGKPVVLAFDELQKIPGWSDIVKARFELNNQRPPKSRPRVILSGSSALMIERGLTESLAGRFELIRFPHWDFQEMKEAFGTNMQKYIAMGGYPRLSEFQSEAERFLEYIRDSVIEPVLSKDILLLHPVNKPALLRRLFEFSCHHCAEIVSLQKMLGQLTDKGNVTIIADYLHLMEKAFLVVSLQKYSPEILRIRSSSPKLIVLSQALVSAVRNITPGEISDNPELFGRIVENAVGAALFRLTARTGGELFYWRDRNDEVDYIIKSGRKLIAVEVKSGLNADKTKGLSMFLKRNKTASGVVIGAQSENDVFHIVKLEEFFKNPAQILEI